MLFNDSVVFIHIPKTGGTSTRSYLVRHLKTPLYVCAKMAPAIVRDADREGLVAVPDIIGHCSLAAAAHHIARLTGRSVAEKSLVVAGIRNPVTLEYSFYKSLQTPEVIKRRKQRYPELLKLAQGDFKTFVAKAGYHTRGMQQHEYVLLDGCIPPNVALVKLEELEETLPGLIEPFADEVEVQPLRRENVSGARRAEITPLMDDELVSLIYQKHQYMYDHGYYKPGEF